MAADLGLSRIQLGLILAGFAWGYAIFQFPGGVLGDRIGARRALTYLAVCWAFLNLLVAFVPGRIADSAVIVIGALTALRFLMGAAQAPLFPIIGGGTTGHWFPVSGWALPNAMQNAGATFGAAATGPLIVWLMERAGWRGSFLLTAPAGLLLAAVWWWYVRDRPAEHPGVSGEERALIDAGRSAADFAPPDPRRVAHGAPKPPGAAARARLLLRQLSVLLLLQLAVRVSHRRAGLPAARRRLVRRRFPGWPAPWGPSSAAGSAIVCGSASARGAPAAISAPRDWPSPAHCCSWQPWRRIPSSRSCSSRSASPPSSLPTRSIGRRRSRSPGAMRRPPAACMNTGGNIVGGVGALMVPVIVDRLGWPAALVSAALFAFAAAGLWLVTAADRAMDQSAESAPAQALA